MVVYKDLPVLNDQKKYDREKRRGMMKVQAKKAERSANPHRDSRGNLSPPCLTWFIGRESCESCESYESDAWSLFISCQSCRWAVTEHQMKAGMEERLCLGVDLR